MCQQCINIARLGCLAGWIALYCGLFLACYVQAPVPCGTQPSVSNCHSPNGLSDGNQTHTFYFEPRLAHGPSSPFGAKCPWATSALPVMSQNAYSGQARPSASIISSFARWRPRSKFCHVEARMPVCASMYAHGARGFALTRISSFIRSFIFLGVVLYVINTRLHR